MKALQKNEKLPVKNNPTSSPNILIENADFIVIDKPSGWFSIPAREPKNEDCVVTDWLRKEKDIEPWVVHRLDRFTTGAMMIAKNKAAHAEGNRWFEERLVKKVYLFFASPLTGSSLPGRPAVQIKTPIDGKPSQTLFEVLDRTPKVFLGKATPLTGRFHQIREHAQKGRFPLVGDASYGFNAKAVGIDFPRVALHASQLTLPFGLVTAPFPLDMKNLLDQLGLKLK